HLPGVRVEVLDDPPQHLGEVHRRPPLGHPHVPPPQQGLADHEQVGHALPPVLVVVPGRATRADRQRRADLADQLLRPLVDAHHRPVLAVRPVVHLQHVLHPGHELTRRAARGQAPLLLQVRLDDVFFIARRTVSVETDSTTSSSTSLSASIFSVHAFRSSGGFEQATAISLASAAPSSTRCRLGLSRVLRTRAASSPCSTNRWRTRATVSVLTSTASAVASSAQAGPPSARSALSRMRAWASFLAAALPAAIRAVSCSRSSAVSV